MITEKPIQKRKPNDFWTDENIISELKVIIEDINRFPSQRDLKKLNKSDLLSAMKKKNGIIYYRDELGYTLPRKQRGFWTNESIISELKTIISELKHFPLHNELNEMKRSDLSNAISNHGGINYYREKLGFESPQKNKGYWNESSIIIELKIISSDIGHFPTRKELIKMDRSDLVAAIDRHASFIKFRIILNYRIANAEV